MVCVCVYLFIHTSGGYPPCFFRCGIQVSKVSVHTEDNPAVPCLCPTGQHPHFGFFILFFIFTARTHTLSCLSVLDPACKVIIQLDHSTQSVILPFSCLFFCSFPPLLTFSFRSSSLRPFCPFYSFFTSLLLSFSHSLPYPSLFSPLKHHTPTPPTTTSSSPSVQVVSYTAHLTSSILPSLLCSLEHPSACLLACLLPFPPPSCPSLTTLVESSFCPLSFLFFSFFLTFTVHTAAVVILRSSLFLAVLIRVFTAPEKKKSLPTRPPPSSL